MANAPTRGRATAARGAARRPADRALLARENDAWSEIVARYRRRVFHIAYKFTSKHDQAEDLTQDIFVKLLRSLDKFHRDADFGTWLTSVARHYCIDHYRASKREREVLVEDLVAFDHAPAASGNPHRALEDRDTKTLLRRVWISCRPSFARRWCCAISRA